jgi:hypothetical protein
VVVHHHWRSGSRPLSCHILKVLTEAIGQKLQVPCLGLLDDLHGLLLPVSCLICPVHVVVLNSDVVKRYSNQTERW